MKARRPVAPGDRIGLPATSGRCGHQAGTVDYETKGRSMGSTGSRTRAIDRVQDHVAVAEACGASCWRVDMDPGEVRRYVNDWGTGNMTAAEVAALRALTPATFWAAFTRGWNTAGRTSSTFEGDTDE